MYKISKKIIYATAEARHKFEASRKQKQWIPVIIEKIFK